MGLHVDETLCERSLPLIANIEGLAYYKVVDAMSTAEVKTKQLKWQEAPIV